MAKTVGPLLSQDAHGSLSKILTYSRRKSGSQVRKYNKPLAPPSASQRSHRRLNEFATIMWLSMSAATKASWEVLAKASNTNLPGYHYFLREALRSPYTVMDLVGYWSCNSIVNNQVLDYSGNNLHATLKPTPPSNAPSLVRSLSPKFGNTLLYDGDDDYCECPLSSKLDLTQNFTLFAWVKQTISAAVNKGAIGKYDAGGRISYSLKSGHGSTWAMLISVGDSNYDTTPDIIIDTDWNFLAGTYDGETLLFYVNGIERASNSDMSGSIDITSAERFRLGSTRILGQMPGYVDEACVFKRLILAPEILKHYQYGVRGAY